MYHKIISQTVRLLRAIRQRTNFLRNRHRLAKSVSQQIADNAMTGRRLHGVIFFARARELRSELLRAWPPVASITAAAK